MLDRKAWLSVSALIHPKGVPSESHMKFGGLYPNLCALCASASADPALSFYVAYHFVAELLSFPIASTLL